MTPDATRTSLAIERAFPDPSWNDAATTAGAYLEPYIASQNPEVVRLVIKPLTAPDGSSLPHLMMYELYDATHLVFRNSILVTAGKIVQPNEGDAGAANYLHVLGFPATHLDVGLVYETMFVYGVVQHLGHQPSALGWNDLSSGMSVEPVALVYDKSSATIFVSSVINMNQMPPLFKRTRIRFDANARITVTSERAIVSGKWESIPVER